jgi:PAS domain S-box-containing protein
MDSLANAPSLLNYLDAPVVVADPDGCVVFLNPAFEYLFATSRERCEGRALAEVFEGGDREAVLAAVAATCSRGQSVRFRIRHHDRGFQVLASPIAVDGQRVGSVLLLTEDLLETEGLHRVKRELGGAVEQLTGCLDRLARPDEQLAEGERNDWAASARGALADCRRAANNLGRLADGQDRQRDREAMIDPSRVLRDAVAGVAYEMAESGVSIDVLLSADLPMVRGDGKRFQEALEALLRIRVTQASDWLTLGGRGEAAGGEKHVVVTLTDPGGAGDLPPMVTECVTGLGGTVEIRTLDDGHRATVLRLPAL